MEAPARERRRTVADVCPPSAEKTSGSHTVPSGSRVVPDHGTLSDRQRLKCNPLGVSIDSASQRRNSCAAACGFNAGLSPSQGGKGGNDTPAGKVPGRTTTETSKARVPCRPGTSGMRTNGAQTVKSTIFLVARRLELAIGVRNTEALLGKLRRSGNMHVVMASLATGSNTQA